MASLGKECSSLPLFPRPGAPLGVQESLTALHCSGRRQPLQCGTGFETKVEVEEEEARAGPSLPSPNPNDGIHPDPVWGSSHTPTLIHEHLCSSFPHLHWFSSMGWGEGRGGNKGAPLWLKLATGLLGVHKNMRILSSQQAMFPLVRPQVHGEHRPRGGAQICSE